MKRSFYMPRENILFFLDAQSMTDENYDILDEMEMDERIDKLTSKTVNTFVFYTVSKQIRVALSNLTMETYARRLKKQSPFIKL